MKIKYGSNRTVILLGQYAFKFPSTYSHTLFLKGCLSNWKERSFFKNFKGVYCDGDLTLLVAPSYFCSWFGICQIQKRIVPLCDLDNRDLALFLLDQKKDQLSKVCSDLNISNVGIINNEIKVLDYAD